MRISSQFGIIQKVIVNSDNFLFAIFEVYELGVMGQFGPKILRV